MNNINWRVIVGLFFCLLVFGTICDFYVNEYLPKYGHTSEIKVSPIEMDILQEKTSETNNGQIKVPAERSS